MKRKKIDLYRLVTFSNLLSQYNIVKKNCKNKKKLFDFSLALNANIINIGQKLTSNNYTFSSYSVFLLREKKYRIIMSECMNDKIVSHFITNYSLKPILEKKMIPQNVATREGLGSSAAYEIFEKYIEKIGPNNQIYALKIDISKYFYSIPHDKLKDMLAHDIRDKFTLSLLYKIIDQSNDVMVNKKIDTLIRNEKNKLYKNKKLSKDQINNLIRELDRVPRYEYGRGLSIGCVVNQILSVYYLTPLDRYIREELKMSSHVRYMDDTVILSTDKEHLKNVLPKIEEKINELGLRMNMNSNVFSINHGFTFLGKTYSIYNNKLVSRTTNKTKRKALQNLTALRNCDFEKYMRSKGSYRSILLNSFLYTLKEEFDYLTNKYPDVFIISTDLETTFNNNLLHPKINNIGFIKEHKTSFKSITNVKTITKVLDCYNQKYILINTNRAVFKF